MTENGMTPDGPMRAIARAAYRLIYGPVCRKRGHAWRARWKPLSETGQPRKAEVWWCVRCKARKPADPGQERA